MAIKELRISKGLTQKEAAALTGIPLRTYKNYENDSKKYGSIKYNYIVDTLNQYGFIDETHGILTKEEIAERVSFVLKQYDVDYCILFGSYAKGVAHEKSDVDLLLSTGVTGLKFFGIVEALKAELHKNVDVLDVNQLLNNAELTNEILKEGIRVYVQDK